MLGGARQVPAGMRMGRVRSGGLGQWTRREKIKGNVAREACGSKGPGRSRA